MKDRLIYLRDANDEYCLEESNLLERYLVERSSVFEAALKDFIHYAFGGSLVWTHQVAGDRGDGSSPNTVLPKKL